MDKEIEIGKWHWTNDDRDILHFVTSIDGDHVLGYGLIFWENGGSLPFTDWTHIDQRNWHRATLKEVEEKIASSGIRVEATNVKKKEELLDILNKYKLL